jgi:hypothetical protein
MDCDENGNWIMLCAKPEILVVLEISLSDPRTRKVWESLYLTMAQQFLQLMAM